MSDFKKFRALLQDHFNEMVKSENHCLSLTLMRMNCTICILTASRLARMSCSVSVVSMTVPAAAVL